MLYMSKQRGVSLFSVILFGAIVFGAIVGGKDVIEIPYVKYKAKDMLKTASRWGSDISDEEISKKFDELVRREGVEAVFTSENLDISRVDKQLTLSLHYRHCGVIPGGYEFCQSQDLTFP